MSKKYKNAQEEKIYMEAFKAAGKGEGKDLSVKDRMEIAQKALDAYRAQGEKRAKSVSDLIKERHRKGLDET